jgi:nucleoside-diphosphate-sugar epimerase
LGALQSPDCAADPEKGVAINVTGTMNLFRQVAELESPVERFVFASSGAVYGKRAMYPEATVAENVELAPPNYYGVWKVAGEHLAALFHEQTGIPTVSLRLNTTYGPGRDLGMTSAPTKVMKSLVCGSLQGQNIPCLMPYTGRENYHYVEDVGAHFAGVCMLPFEGCQALNIKGKTVEVSEFLEAIRQIAQELGIADHLETGIAADATANLFICDLDDSAVEAQFPGLPRTEIAEGIRRSLTRFQTLAAAGKLRV